MPLAWLCAMILRFDRGTILVLDASMTLRDRPVPALLWDGRVGAWRAPAFLYAHVRASLPAAQIERDSVDAAPPSVSGLSADGLALRPYQLSALQAWELARRRGLVI